MTDFLILPMCCQNAALNVSKTVEGFVIECYEISPQNEAVMSSARLQMTFPAQAILIPDESFLEESFLQEFCTFLRKLNAMAVDAMSPRTQKAGTSVAEHRDSVHPHMVTQLLMAILATEGTYIRSHPIAKNIRDNACYESSLLPWRRCPLWLVIRVSLQLMFARTSGPEIGRKWYKDFMCHVYSNFLETALNRNCNSENLYLINLKLGRRAAKLGLHLGAVTAEKMTGLLVRSHSIIRDRWVVIQQKDRESRDLVPHIGPVDTQVKLAKSEWYIRSRLQDAHNPRLSGHSDIDQVQSWTRLSFLGHVLPNSDIFLQDCTPQLYALFDFESWVDLHLTTWTENVARNENTCIQLRSLIQDYYHYGKSRYEDDAKQLSTMYLTVFELWCVLDQIATSACPMIGRTRCEIPATILEPLLLSEWKDLTRLSRVEAYIRSRQGNISAFGPIGDNSFGVQYFDTCDEMRTLKSDIENDARDDESLKMREWQRVRAEFESLMSQAARCTHKHNRYGIACDKCMLEKRAKDLSITIYEWPLPDNESHAKAVVFELRCPLVFKAWREILWMLLHELRPRHLQDRHHVEETLPAYSALRRYHGAHVEKSGLSLGSSTKSFARSHYRVAYAHSADTQISVPNALHFELFDQTSGTLTANTNLAPDIKANCILTVDHTPYAVLQWALNSSTHYENSVIAEQGSFPPDLSFHEFDAFGTLRSGERVQWINILRELVSSNLQWNTIGVRILIEQCIWEAGTSTTNDVFRAAQIICKQSTFVQALLSATEWKLTSIKANWNELHCIQALTAITAQLHNLLRDQLLRDQAQQILLDIRSALVQWIDDLLLHLQELIDDDAIRHCQDLLCYACICCHATFDILKTLQPTEIFPSETSVAIYVKCSIIIQDNLPVNPPVNLRPLHRRDERLALQLLASLQQMISFRGSGFTMGIQKITGIAHIALPWTFADSQRLWIKSVTAGNKQSVSQSVYYNLFNGTLLVDGKRIGRLPATMTGNPIYQELFKSQILEVIPSGICGLSYQTTRLVSGYRIHFGSSKENIIIRAVKNNEHLELIDRNHFKGDLPDVLITDCVHWLDLNNAQILCKSRKSPWDPSQKQWQIECASSHFLVRFEERHLVDYEHPTACYLLSLFTLLDHREHILISRGNDELIEVELTRLKLHFFVRPDRRIQCRELRALVDTRQNLGTLIGLKNRLVLHGLNKLSGKLFRFVIIPYGQIRVIQKDGHAQVSIMPLGKPVIRYVTLTVDGTLKCLRAPAEFQARLYHAMLHAVCSGLLADPLTDRTGTEEALSCLEEAVMYQCAPLTDDSFAVLHAIAQISPKRMFYPSHLKVMETTSWRNDLPLTVQADDFVLIVQNIINYNNRFRAFQGHQDTISLGNGCNLHLSERALHRAPKRLSNALGSGQSLTMKDHDFVARDRTYTASGSRQPEAVFEIGMLLKTWGKGNQVDPHLYDTFLKWQTVSGFRQEFEMFNLNDLSTLELEIHWGAIYSLCTASTSTRNRWKLTFLFTTMVFGKPDLLPHLRTLLEFAFRPVLPGFSNIPEGDYQVSLGHEPFSWSLRSLIDKFRVDFRSINWGESETSYNHLKAKHDGRTSQHLDHLIACAVQLWPCAHPGLPNSFDSTLIQAGYIQPLREHFAILYRNLQLREATSKVMDILKSRKYDSPAGQRYVLTPKYIVPIPTNSFLNHCQRLTLYYLLNNRPCPSIPVGKVPIRKTLKRPTTGDSCDELDDLISAHEQRGGRTRESYCRNLKASSKALKAPAEHCLVENDPTTTELEEERSEHEQYLASLMSRVVESLRPRNPGETIAQLADLWPRMDVRLLLAVVSPRRHEQLEKAWRSLILHLGQTITMYQRATRLLKHAEAHDQVAYRKELANCGYDGWSPAEYPEWLLMQVEHDFLIRKVQVDVAKHMISPENDECSVMQLNMGEGKSSVIIPMVAAALANGHRLVRIVVLRPLFAQMMRVLNERLGGLIGRRIMSVPFHRQMHLSSNQVGELRIMYRSWEDRGDIFLVQPEHILSFKLMGLDRLYNGQYHLANEMLALQSWSNKHCRNLLDESDELLSPTFELVYTIGSQRLVSGQPDRWILAQHVLSLIEGAIWEIYERHPSGVEINSKFPGAFPSIRLLSERAASSLMAMVVSRIGKGSIPEISFEHCSTHVKEAALDFIESREICADVEHTVLEYYDKSITLDRLLILRGLIAHGVVFFALHHKRWMVNYGLHRDRCLMAVPYRAKGVPSLTAEFGHPDCAIMLTCLSFYYEGLTEQQLRHCFQLLFGMVDPTVEYDIWQKRLDLPPELQIVSGVNMDDPKQWTEFITPSFRKNKATIDFFLSNVAFPREAKEFDFKLSTSGWDLASECNLSTGFSGTNDLCSLNPLSVRQRDIPELLKTSALVLQDLLRPENRHVVSIPGKGGQMIDVGNLIDLASNQSPQVQVIIDVGAQVLEMTNRNIIELWLLVNASAVAGVYFDDGDNPVVLDRTGNSERLVVSGYRGKLEDCVVFLDEAHTRGIDLELPSNFRAMVTLGPNLTKDRFVQGKSLSFSKL